MKRLLLAIPAALVAALGVAAATGQAPRSQAPAAAAPIASQAPTQSNGPESQTALVKQVPAPAVTAIAAKQVVSP